MKDRSPIESNRRAYDDKRISTRVFGVLGWLTFLFIGMALAGWWLELSVRTVLFIGVEMLMLWSAVVAIIQGFYIRCVRRGDEEVDAHSIDSESDASTFAPRKSSYASIWQWVLLLLGLALLWKISYPGLMASPPMSQLSVDNLSRVAVFLLGCAAVLYFLTNYAWVVQKNVGTTLLNPILYLSRVVYLACAVSSVLTFVFLSTQQDYSRGTGWFFIGLTLLLALEPLLRFAGRFYLPKSQRRVPAPVGTSLLLDTLSGAGRGLRNLRREMENLIGMKVGEIWILRFMRETVEAVVFSGLVLGWLSTCLTAVPLGSRGVLVSFGSYQSGSLGPGLHLSLPWPLGEIDPVETERVREFSLGFEQDLAGPILWTENHYVGEQNLLVGDGESLLTIDVPIQYRVSDPVAFLKATTDAPMALKSLAERKLIQVTQSRDSFQIMTTDREEMALELRKGLQSEADRLGLGLQIIFVGLKDIHPPVDVAPAYEEVVSAQEQKEAAIDQGKAYEASVLPTANASAQRLMMEADAAKTQRVDQATGEAARFSSLVAAEHEAPDLFRDRLRYDALDDTLFPPVKIIVGLSGANLPDTYLDLRSIRYNGSDMGPE